MQDKIILGIDVGASGIKAATVNVETGTFERERYRIDMPNPSTPEAVSEVIRTMVKHFDYTGKIGVGFPSVVKKGVSSTASNIDKSWVGTNIETLFADASGCPVYAANDADVAGLAEMKLLFEGAR